LAGDHLSHAVINGQIYAIGGEHDHHSRAMDDNAQYVQHKYLFRYDPASDTWTRLADAPFGGSHNEGTTLVINGKILAPDGSISLFASNPSYASARAGVVASTIDLAASSAVTADQFAFKVDDDTTSSDVPPQRRTVKVVATVDGSGLTETVIATIDNFGTRPIRVFSWRVS